MPSEVEKACLGCTLPICDDKDAACMFVQIERRVPYFAARYLEKRGPKQMAACRFEGCEVEIVVTKQTSGLCKRHRKRLWQREARRRREPENLGSEIWNLKSETAAAVNELVQVGFEKFGGRGDCEPIVLRGKDKG
jgi:hypothetical protein